MNLAFMTHVKGKATLFTNKIIKSIWQHFGKEMTAFCKTNPLTDDFYVFEDTSIFEQEKLYPKIHSMRAGSRWRAGMKIHFIINNRSPKRYQFAPIIPCVSVQGVIIEHHPEFGKRVFVEKNKEDMFFRLLSLPEIEKLSENDGFDSIIDFWDWFSEDFSGQIIHWTDERY